MPHPLDLTKLRRCGVVATVGDRIVVDSEKVGTPAREGEILEIIEAATGIRYRVRWDDGHESTFWPSAGNVRTLPPKAPQRA